MATDKFVALSNDPQQINVTYTHEPGPNLFEKLDQLAQRLAQAKPVHAACVNEAQSLPNGETVPDSGAENGSNAREQAGKKES
jgi:hypothetical protein